MRARKILGVLLLSGVSAWQAAQGADYNAADAASHVGETATVTDKVSRVNKASGGNVFVNMGASREASFTAFISTKVADKFPDVNQYEGKTITVSGTIATHKDKPEIVVTDPSQITVKDEAARDSSSSEPAKSSSSPAASPKK